MEFNGPKKALKGLDDKEVYVHELVTDRHTQVRKHTEQRPAIPNFTDAWHVSKG